MKLVTFAADDGPRIGALLPGDDLVADLQATALRAENKEAPYLASMLSFLDAGSAAREHAERLVVSARNYATTVPRAGLRLLAPVPRPLSIRDCVGFLGHLENCMRVVMAGGRLKRVDAALQRMTGWTLAQTAARTAYERPVYYFSNVCAVVGTDQNVEIPPYTRELDYELEWSACIGRRGANIRAADARAYIAGYTIFNDVSARDVQMQEIKGRLGVQKSKSFDGSNVMGPCLVTPDEIPDPYALGMWATVNGEEWSRGSTRQQDWSFEELIEYISRSETLHPGEFICSGTVPTGCGLELGRRLRTDDTVELHVERIGTLRTRFVSTAAFAQLPLKDKRVTRRS